MAIEIKAPNRNPKDKFEIFLAGSIEMGTAENWQTKIVNCFKDEDIIFLNPRRDDWDSSWKQEINNPEFFQQVMWELNNIKYSDLVIFYFDPNTKSPITLLELGYCIGSKPWDIIVYCPQGFWRKGNVDIICFNNNVKQVETFEELINYISKKVNG